MKKKKPSEGDAVYICEIKIENFRAFGAGSEALLIPLKAGLTAIVGENDAGKTAVVDALRMVLGTRDQDTLRLDITDFHQPSGSASRADQITVRLTFAGLTAADKSAFSEFLTYVTNTEPLTAVLVVTWVAKRSSKDEGARRYIPTEWRTGAAGDGPLFDASARALLTATYLRPLRDAERAMSAGRGSRLSQILQHTKEIKETGIPFDTQANADPDPKTLSVLGLGDYANHLFGENDGVRKTRLKLNKDYLEPLSFADDMLNARIGVSGSKDDSIRLRQLLEKLEVILGADDVGDAHLRGLGSNNLLFMACELLLLATESDGFPILLIEEPEAHLHPQRQLRLMSFLQEQSKKKREDQQQIQIIVTTHSPNLASEIPLDNLVLLQGRRAFSLAREKTALSVSDYKFLERFLDVTKSNLFFARAVLIVEGDAENILMPVLAKLVGRDFRAYGVSIVNVGGVGLGRYARIFIRSNAANDGVINVPVACLTDMDVMPDCAPWIVGHLKQGELIPVLGSGTRRKWRRKSDFVGTQLEELRAAKEKKANGQRVKTFVADDWTLEYDLSNAGFELEVWVATEFALCDEQLNTGSLKLRTALRTALKSFQALLDKNLFRDERLSHIYSRLTVDGASKAITAQYLASILERRVRKGSLSSSEVLSRLPSYVRGAIEYVTAGIPAVVAADAGGV